jgi:hypothetical protein
MTRHAAVACLVALVAVGAAGCASSGTSPATAGSSAKAAGGSPAASGGTPAASDPLAALSADSTENKAVADTFAATSVRIAGTTSDSGTPLSFTLTLRGHSTGCEGTLSEGAKGSFQIIVIGKTVWIKPDNTFWKAAGSSDPSVFSILSGKWLEDSSGSSGLGGMSTMCSLNGLLGAFKTSATGLVKGATSTVDGQRVLQLTQSGQTTSVYVSDTADPVIVRIMQPGANGGSFDLTGYGAPFSVTAPPASETLSGKDYGF